MADSDIETDIPTGADLAATVDVRCFERLRPAGLLDQYSTARHDLGFYQNVACSGYYSTTTGETSLMPLIYRTLAALVAQHPMLGAIVVDEHTTAPYFVRLPHIDLNGAVSFVRRRKPFDEKSIEAGESDVELDGILAQQHSTSFKAQLGQRPFWRLLVLYSGIESSATDLIMSSSFVAAFVYHHALGDGTSGPVFQRHFFSALQSASTSTPPPDDPIATTGLVTPPPAPLPPSLEEVHPLPLGKRYTVRAIWDEICTPSPRTTWLARPVSTTHLATRFRSLIFPASLTNGFVHACRAHDASVTSAAQTLIASALFTNLPTHFKKLTYTGAISFRRFLDPSIVTEDMIGAWLSTFRSTYKRPALFKGGAAFDAEAFWAEAQRSRDIIRKELALEGRNTDIGLLRLIKNMHGYLTGDVGKTRKMSFEVSSIGAFKLPKDAGGGPWTLGRVLFSQSTSVTGAVLDVTIMTGVDGALTWGFSWQEGILEDAFVEKIMETIKRRVEELTVGS